MRVLVTGGAGYLGSTLVPALLDSGKQVRVLDALLHGGRSLLGVWAHPSFEFVKGDVRDADAVREALDGVDAVVHLAAIVGDPACARQPDLARAVNRDASLALLDAAERAGASRFIFASTCSNYGKMKDPNAFVDETAELSPVSLYAETKVDVEGQVLSKERAGAMCRTALRFATIFGVSPRMRFDLTVNEFTLKMLVEGELAVFGEQFWRPYVHVRDAARGIQAVLDADVARVDRTVFNVGSTSQNHTKKQLVEMIARVAPDAIVRYVHRDEDPRDYRVSFDRIEKTLGYKTTRDVAQGIGEVAGLVRSQVLEDFDAPAYKN
jgi:nucleoside-diphosphate-sugar epimerase